MRWAGRERADIACVLSVLDTEARTMGRNSRRPQAGISPLLAVMHDALPVMPRVRKINRPQGRPSVLRRGAFMSLISRFFQRGTPIAVLGMAAALPSGRSDGMWRSAKNSGRAEIANGRAQCATSDSSGNSFETCLIQTFPIQMPRKAAAPGQRLQTQASRRTAACARTSGTARRRGGSPLSRPATAVGQQAS